MQDTLALDRADRLVLRILAVLAAVTGAFAAGFGVAHSVALLDGSARVELLAEGDLPGADDRADAAVETASVSAAALADGDRALLVTGTLIEVAAGAVITFAVLVLLVRLAGGQPFHRSLFRSGVAAGFAMLVGGMLGTGIRGLGQMSAAQALNGGVAGGAGPFQVAFAFEPGPWWLAFVVLALAMVFRIGARLQRETEGLV
ncbi:hypothetical protein [Homoserinibacter sp. YIM 151385]|uniref:hypothetical protein n=1 Tax=Homoserinibacter sp. YIM 151385 TaxID=2985506 RepID=UPI0022F0DFBB|nr:hypothetical protein [Homoserinibacter sp. YIM 151385]WBU37566.1 hypothetical protein OF852_11685 [Homoserinibacter sp. YIM 151385]